MEREVRDNNPAGDCVAEGGSDWRKDAGDEGGAMKGRTMAFEGVWFSATEMVTPGNIGSGTRTA